MEDIFQLLLECPEEKIEDIILEKAKQLEEAPSTERKIIIPNESLYGYESYYHGFIKSDVKIFSSMGNSDDECYTLGNYDYLISFFKFIRDSNISNKNDAIISLATFMDQYFGEYCGIDQRADYLKKYDGEATIDVFKGMGLAACSERAAVANNILTMLGANAYFISGEVNGEQHAFNIILNRKNQFRLVDTTSCCGLYDSNNNLVGKTTYINNLGEINDKLEGFLLNEQPLKFYDMIARIDANGKIKYEGNGKIKQYKAEPILLDETKNKSH